MSNPDVEIRKVMRQVDHYAARLNPGLAAVAIILSTLLLGDIALRYQVFFANQLAAAGAFLTSDPMASSPGDTPPSE